ncbi:MAG: alpha-amylase [Candidatus Riflebacteria bacterium]|nr:alpha-amylase [Candidatus Riflebacteria bacterium]
MQRQHNFGMIKTFLMLLAAFLFLTPAFADPPARVSRSVIMQGFGWDSINKTQGKWYDLIGSKAAELKKLGIDFVWFPPPTHSVSRQGYMPGDYYDLGTSAKPNFYGSKESLVAAIRALKAQGIGSLADIVINHRCGNKQDEKGIWNIYDFPNGKASWQQWAICKGSFGGQGNPDTGDSFPPAPDIDHTNKKVQEDIIEWMNWLKKLGFAGWRYDYVRGYAPKFNGIYDKATSPLFSVGEYWVNMNFKGSELLPNQDSHRQKSCDWLDKNPSEVACIFDFTTKGILQVAVKGEYWRLKDSKGKPTGLIGWWPARAVTFIDNHDTGSKQSHWPFPASEIMQGYAYILTHPGIPCVFWEHVYDMGHKNDIAKLIQIRKACKINSTTPVEILVAENGLYAAKVGKYLAMKLGTRDWVPGDGYKLAASGPRYAVWVKSAN